MDATIYSIGSSAYLKEIIMAVTSIIGTGGFSKLIQSGLLLGVLIMAFQTLFNGGKPVAVHQIAVSGLLFALMFGPTVDVAIEGVYDGQSHAVADVPIGIALPGSLVSQVGYGLTEMFETAFSSPSGATSGYGLTDGAGYADALKMLMEIRRNGNNADLLSTIDSVGTGGTNNFRGSWDNYIRECTAMKIDLNDISIEQIYNEGDHMDGLKFESELFGTVITHNGATQTLSCTAAFAALEAWTTSVVASEEVKSAIGRQIGLHSTGGHGSLAEPDTDAFVAANGALGALSQSATGAQQYIQTAILEPIFHQAMSGRYRDIHDFSASTMINQALQQRNVQWAAEQTIFMSIVRPMITFIEGFAYAITPFMAFIIVLGAFGMKLAIKYGQMLLWIQLWLPVLAITNFFLYMVASSELAQLDNATTSFYELHQAGERLGYWVSVGGMLAAATPILTLVLLTGSTYAMTSLAQKMGGSDHVDEKQMAPDVLRQGAVMDQVSMQSSGTMTGRSNTGSETFMPNLQLSEALQSSKQSSSQEMQQASSTLLGSAVKSFSSSDSQQISNSRAEALNQSLQSSNTQAHSALESAATQWREDHGVSEDYQSNVQAMFTAAASTGVPQAVAKFLPGSASIAGSGVSSDLMSQKVSSADVASRTGGMQFSESDQSQLAESLAGVISNQTADTRGSMWQSSNTSSIGEQASEVTSASQSYQESSAASSQIGSGLNTNAQHLGQRVSDTPAANQMLNDYFRANPHLNSLANEQADFWKDEYGMDAGTALAASRMDVLSRQSSYGGDQQAYSDGSNQLASVVAAATGSQPVSAQGNAGANAGIGANIPTPGQVGSGAGANIPGRSDIGTNGQVFESAINAHNEDGRQDVNERTEEGFQEVRASNQAKAIDLSSSGPDPSEPIAFAPFAGGTNSALNRYLEGQHSFNPQHAVDSQTIIDRAPDRDSFIGATASAMTPDVAGAVYDGYHGNAAPSGGNASSGLAFEAGQALKSGTMGEWSDAYAQEGAMDYARSLNLSEGAATVYAASQVQDTNLSRSLFEEGQGMLRNEVAENLGTSPDELSHEAQTHVNRVASQAYNGARAGGGDLGSADMPLVQQHSRITSSGLD